MGEKNMVKCAYPKCDKNSRVNALKCDRCDKKLADMSQKRSDKDFLQEGSFKFPPEQDVVLGNVINCPDCGAKLRGVNSKYCSDRCSKLAYVYHRYRNDPDFHNKMKKSSKKYGRTSCPKCGGMKDRYAEFCGKCVSLTDRFVDVPIGTLDDMFDNIDELMDDKESIFGNPESTMKMQIFGIIKGERDITKEEVFEIIKMDYGRVFEESVLTKAIDDIWDEVKA